MFNLNKIFIQIQGGLGNQLFQYSKALEFKSKFGGTILPFKTFDRPFNTKRKYLLDDILLTQNTNHLRNYLSCEWYKYFEPLDIIKENKNFCYQNIFYQKKNVFLLGYWQTFRNAEILKIFLKKYFIPNYSISSFGQSYLNLIKNSNSVSIHIRRGDYLTNKYANEFHGVLPLEYYQESIKIIKKKFKNFSLFFFSDDIQWCKSNFGGYKNSTFIELPNRKDHFAEIFLMSHCNHSIIANSSFSWWGAFLGNQNNDRVVIAPKNWVNQENSIKDLIPYDWHMI